jgi:hypothetical protein
MSNNLKEKKIIILASLIIPLGELAIYVQKQKKIDTVLLDLLHNNPEIVTIKVKRIVKKVMLEKKSTAILKELKSEYYDSDRIIFGAAYFDATLLGTEKELKKIAGKNKVFSYDWIKKE